MGSTTCVKRSLENYEGIVGLKPPERVSQPIHPGYHPELDTTDIMDSDGRQIYWSLIGMLQWAVTLGHLEIHHATMCMSRFRAEPRQGHLQAVAKIFGYLDHYRSSSIKFWTGIPDCSEIEKEQPVEYDCSYIYGKVKEMTDPNLPKAKGKSVRALFFIDANLGHDKVTGRRCCGIISMLNLTPIDSCCKLTNTVETTSYGSEFTVARIGVDKVLAECYKLRALGVPIDGPAYMFGDNKSVVLSSTIRSHALNKRHNFLSSHRVQERIAATHNGQPILKFCTFLERRTQRIATRSLSQEVRSTGILSHDFTGLTGHIIHSSILSRWGVTSEPILGHLGQLFIPFRTCLWNTLNNHSDKRRSVLLAQFYRNPVIDCYLLLVCRYLSIYRLSNLQKCQNQFGQCMWSNERNLDVCHTQHDQMCR